MNMQKDWRFVARRHWSVRWMAASIVLSFFEAALPAAQPYLPAWVNQLWVAVAIGICSAVGLACKFIAQKDINNGAAA